MKQLTLIALLFTVLASGAHAQSTPPPAENKGVIAEDNAKIQGDKQKLKQDRKQKRADRKKKHEMKH